MTLPVVQHQGGLIKRGLPAFATLTESVKSKDRHRPELAERMGRPLKTINEIVVGKARIASDTALQLEKVLGVPASFWTNQVE